MRSCDAAKLARVLGLLGSEFPGERASAALAAHRLMKRLGLSWQDLLVPRQEAMRGPSHPRGAAPPPAEVLDAAQSRLRQCQRENGDLQRQITRLKRRLENLPPRQPPPEWQD
ncbi:MAG TPA: hypothetical protein VIL69_03545 [Roseomonas sp.]|jgi:hypothetical protein